jgi:hypothetical protein
MRLFINSRSIISDLIYLLYVVRFAATSVSDCQIPGLCTLQATG